MRRFIDNKDSSEIPLLNAAKPSRHAYGSVEESKNSASSDHIILIADDTKEEKITIQKKRKQKKSNMTVSLIVYCEELKKCIAIVESAINEMQTFEQRMHARQRRLGMLSIFIIELVFAAGLGGLSYGCYQDCHDDNRGAELGYTIGLVFIGGIAVICAWTSSLWQDCFNFELPKHSFSLLEQAQLQKCFINDASLDGEKEIWDLRRLRDCLNYRLEKINEYINQAVQAHEHRLIMKRGIIPQVSACALHYSFFKNKLFDANVLNLVFEAVGIDQTYQEKLILQKASLGNS